MTLAENLADIFKKEMQIVIDKEQAEENYLAAENYENNESRAVAGVSEAMDQVEKKLGIYICQHRAEKHGEDVIEEQTKLELELKPEYLDLGVSTKEWWNN